MAQIHCGVKPDIFSITRSLVSESAGRTRDGPGARDCRVFVDTSTQQIVLQICLFWRATLIQTQLGTTAAENHQDTSIDLCSCNCDPLFPHESSHQQSLISQQLLYRDSLEFPWEREAAITRPPRTRHNPNNKESCDCVPGLAEDPDTHKQLATHARESMNFSMVSTPIGDRGDSVYLLRVDN